VGKLINSAANGMIDNQESLSLMLKYGEEISGLDCLVLNGFNQPGRGTVKVRGKNEGRCGEIIPC